MGNWKKREAGLVEYVNSGLVNCILCGKMIPRDIWVSIYNEKKLINEKPMAYPTSNKAKKNWNFMKLNL